MESARSSSQNTVLQSTKLSQFTSSVSERLFQQYALVSSWVGRIQETRLKERQITNYCAWCHQAEEPLSLPGQPFVQSIPKAPTCPSCQCIITLVTIRKACELVCKSKRTIYQWIEKGLVSTVRTASGTPLVCLSSLFAPRDEESGESQQQRTGGKESVQKRAIY